MDLKKTKKILTVLFIFTLLFLLASLYYNFLFVIAIVLLAAYVMVYWNYWRCPKCGKILGRGRETRCPYCGYDSGIRLTF